MNSRLPDPLEAFLHRSAPVNRQPAWLRVGADGCALAAGGDLPVYGLEAIVPGGDVTVVAPYLTGLLPPDGEPLFLPLLAVTDDRFADVYVLPDEDGDWVLLLDATQIATCALPFQQRHNESTLCREQASCRTLKALFGGDDCLVLQRLTDDRFRVAGLPPRWTAPWLAPAAVLHPEEQFPYLRAFLPDAQRFFDGGRSGCLHSDPWSQTLEGGDEVHLEACAMVFEPFGAGLFIAPVGEPTQARQRLIQKAREQGLAHERLNHEVERRDVLAHCIVHDLKGPLSCIQGYLQLARSGVAGAAQNDEFLDMALRQCRRQESLIRDVLDVFASEHGGSGAEERDPTTVLSDVVRGLVNDFRPGFEQAGSALDMETDRDVLGVRVPGDASRMERVFANLLENAKRYTPRGARARVALHHAGAELVACVENEGETIEESRRGRLFERFAQSGKREGAIGLGLFFCRITVERWGGGILYRPLTGGGSCFEVRLPLANT